MKNNIKRVILAVIVTLIVCLSASISYAYFSATITKRNETETQIRSKKIGLIFDDTKEVDVDMYPGKKETKTFTVESDADDEVTYNIKIKDIENTYKNDVVYTLYCDGQKVAGPARLPKTADSQYIYTGITIDAGEKKEYTLEMEYLITEDIQTMNGESFAGTIEIDTESVEDNLIYTPEDTIELSAEKRENIFEFKNISSTTSMTYNIKVPTTNGEDINYTLTKNGETVSSGLIPKDGELPYLLLDQQLQPGQADKYKLKITNVPSGSD